MFGVNELPMLPAYIAALLRRSEGVSRSKDTKREGEISDGQRNSALTSYAGGMRREGLSAEEIETRLHEINSRLCCPPLPEVDVSTIAKSVARYAPSSIDIVQMTLNDVGNADRFVRSVGADVRYVRGWDKWLVWNGVHYEACDPGEIMERAKLVAREIFEEADQHTDGDIRKAIRAHAKSSLSQSRLRSMIELGRFDRHICVSHTALDAHIYRLGLKNGVYDLKLRKFRSHRKSDLITRVSPVAYDPEAQCPTFKKFLRKVVGGDKELYRYITRLMGYLLCGATTEQKLFFLYGHGANGKTTFLNVLRWLLGDQLAKLLPADSLMVRQQGRSNSNDIARLEGARLVVSNEIEEGSFLAESLIKQLTGGDVVTARYLYREYTEFVPQFKLMIAGNHQPVIRGDDLGIWRRLDMIPFVVTITEADRDPHLGDKLRNELAGILNLAIKGFDEWHRIGLGSPSAVTKAVDAYRKEMDLLGKWLREAALRRRSLQWGANDAYSNYTNWCRDNGLAPLSLPIWGRKMKLRFQCKRNNTGNVYLGIGAKSEVV